ncbi:MAG: diguanylate cyclase [Gammaproteobacteria bacterium]|nr:diguanylate cyclase [Gammaproteobacteria bacterium]
MSVQLSIGKLATALIALLIAVTAITTAAGLFVLQKHYHSLEERHHADAHDTVRNAAMAIHNQVRFYQGILQLLAANPDVVNLLEFGDAPDIMQWSATINRLLPGSLGAALTSTEGIVFGDARSQRVGPRCESDLRAYHAGETLRYPLIHTEVAGLEHFDLLTRVTTPDGEQSGTLFVSFQLRILQDLLDRMTHEADEFRLVDARGETRLSSGTGPATNASSVYRADVPGTSWVLELKRDRPAQRDFLTDLVIADGAILMAVAIVMFALVRATHGRFLDDMGRAHRAFVNVLEDRYEPNRDAAGIKEVGILLNDIEQVALKLQNQRNELRQQSLSDPLTGVFNRRYFDLMLDHHHEQSRRQQAAILIIVDLNDFKGINDQHGHAAGDAILRFAAGYLRSRVRASDIVARLGGDEFALILNHMEPDRLTTWLDDLIGDYDREMIRHGELELPTCPFSIGIAAIDAEVYPDAADAFHAADGAMYEIKGRQTHRRSEYALAATTHPAANPHHRERQ